MEITYLGHAGFLVETKEVIIVADPWLSPEGAFDGAWFQFPRNHHLASWVNERLERSSKARFIYISHEHKDHFDLDFLKNLACREFTLVVPMYRRTILRETLAGYVCKGMSVLKDRETIQFPGGGITLYLDDSELNRDSAIVVEGDGKNFLNLNDCKLYDRVGVIRDKHGKIDAFACQFSGATWHPTCYEYSSDQRQRISRKKRLAKFETVARAIETLQPVYYLPSAGPACFLDPRLMYLNFEPESIFPQALEFLSYLERRIRGGNTQWTNWMPGDFLDLKGRGFVACGSERVDPLNTESYLKDYARSYAGIFASFYQALDGTEIEKQRKRLCECLSEKLEHLTLRDRVPIPLYFNFSESPHPLIQVDFRRNQVCLVESISETEYYSITAPARQVIRVLDKQLTWEDFALTFRMRLRRSPDQYQPLIQAFLIMEIEDLKWFCDKLITLEQTQSRIIVDTNAARYQIDRYCPHQGGDLATGWADDRLWTCPRHRWQFDLEKHGKCTSSNCSINAERI